MFWSSDSHQTYPKDVAGGICVGYLCNLAIDYREKTTESVAKSSCNLVLLFNVVIRALTSRGNVEKEFFVVIGAEAESEDFNLFEEFIRV